jgi:hypothetical protein
MSLQSESYHLSHCLFVPADCCSHLKLLATERVNITFCVLLHKSPFETLQILEEGFDGVAMKKMQVYEWHK